MRVGSLFSGIGGFDLGLGRAGMEIAWQAEIDSYCSKVLAAHWPGVPNYGDVRNVGLGPTQCHVEDQSHHSANGVSDPARGWNVDLVCGGFPCQPFSVAGQRRGAADERNLWPEFRRVLSEVRPRWCLIENVPGLLSWDSGLFFGSILNDLGELGFNGVAYAVLDSQHFGVPQRRRRVFIVGGPSRRSAEQVLSLCESCGGHPAPGRAKGEDIAPTLRAGANRTGGDRPPGTDVDTLETLQVVANPLGASTTSFGGQRYDLDNETYVPLAVRTAQTSSNGWGVNTEGTAYTLDGANGQAVASTASVRRLTPTDETLQPHDIMQYASPFEANAVKNLRVLRESIGAEAFAQWGLRVFDSLQPPEVLRPYLYGAGIRPEAGEVRPQLDDRPLARPEGMSTGPVLSLWKRANGSPSQRRGLAEQLARELGQAMQGMPHARPSASVRRLTPVEAERLQGFPDGWTDLGNTADGPRYRALGNAVTVPVIEWLGRRIMEVQTKMLLGDITPAQKGL